MSEASRKSLLSTLPKVALIVLLFCFSFIGGAITQQGITNTALTCPHLVHLPLPAYRFGYPPGGWTSENSTDTAWFNDSLSPYQMLQVQITRWQEPAFFSVGNVTHEVWNINGFLLKSYTLPEVNTSALVAPEVTAFAGNLGPLNGNVSYHAWIILWPDGSTYSATTAPVQLCVTNNVGVTP